MPALVSPFDLLRAVCDEMVGSQAVVEARLDHNAIHFDARGGGRTFSHSVRRADYLAMELVDAVAWAAAYRQLWDQAQEDPGSPGDPSPAPPRPSTERGPAGRRHRVGPRNA